MSSMKTKFWKPKPKEPWSDWRMISMLIPILVSASGFFVTGIFAFSFSDIAVIPDATQSWMVILGSALIIFGAELNTPFTTIEVFRKILREEANRWDISALIASLLGTVVNLLVTFASRLSLNPLWKELILNWGPLLSGFAVACDYYGSMIELGFLFGSYEERVEQWLEEEREWQEEQGVIILHAPEATGLEFDPAWPVMEKGEFMVHLGGMNGAGIELADRRKLEAFICQQERNLPSRSTLNRWRTLARKRG